MDLCEVSWRVCMVDRVLPMPLHAVVFRTCHWPQSNIWGVAGRPLIMYRKLETDLNVLDSFWFHKSKKSKSKTFLSPSRCLRSCCSRCCSHGRFRDRGLVGGSKRGRRGKRNTTNVEKDLGRTWLAKLEWGERKFRKREGEPRDRNRRWMMMNHYDYDGSSLPPKPKNTKNMFPFLGEGKERAYNALPNWKRPTSKWQLVHIRCERKEFWK